MIIPQPEDSPKYLSPLCMQKRKRDWERERKREGGRKARIW